MLVARAPAIYKPCRGIIFNVLLCTDLVDIMKTYVRNLDYGIWSDIKTLDLRG